MVVDSKHLSIGAGGARDLASFTQVDVDLWWSKPVGCARLYFNEAKHVVVVREEIDFGCDYCTAQVSADGESEVGGDEAVAELSEVGCGV